MLKILYQCPKNMTLSFMVIQLIFSHSIFKKVNHGSSVSINALQLFLRHPEVLYSQLGYVICPTGPGPSLEGLSKWTCLELLYFHLPRACNLVTKAKSLPPLSTFLSAFSHPTKLTTIGNGQNIEKVNEVSEVHVTLSLCF